ncbi:MAG: hypothetical protein AAFP69_13415 [Planctomycetota bacterium]
MNASDTKPRGGIMDAVKTLNSAARTVLASAFLIISSTVGYLVYDRVNGDQIRLEQSEMAREAAEEKIVGLTNQIESFRVENERLKTSMRLLKMDQRLALLEIVDQQPDPDNDQQVFTTIRFRELSPDGDPIGEGKQFSIVGDIVYLDNWVVKFEDEFVEINDLQRGTSLALFRRVFGEYQKPSEGFLLDEVGKMPQAYRSGGVPSDFERAIWSEFWTFANDSAKAKAMGIRAAHGEAVSVKAVPGASYRISLRASDGISIEPYERPREVLPTE